MYEEMKMASNLENERLLEQLYEQFLEEGFSPEVAAEKAREEFNRRDFAGAMGGRVSKQTGGITESRVLPPEFLEAAQKTFLADLTRQAGLPTVTTATTQQPGESMPPPTPLACCCPHMRGCGGGGCGGGAQVRRW